MKTKALALLLSLLPAAALAQSAPANLPAQSVYGRLGQPGVPGPGQAIPFANLISSLKALISTNNLSDVASASASRANLGLAIGTNVEAWDADLDCLAALSSTGLLHRTGSGTCSAGAAALSDLANGTQDTVIGYFGSVAASALAINNCANALTYSTSTHTFGCNVSGGTGTVTSVATAGLATGGPISTTGTVTVTAAVKSDQTTATSTSVAVVPGVQQNHPSSVKAWATFSATPTKLDSFNVGTITKTSTGIFVVNFTTAFTTANYACKTSTTGASGGINSNVISKVAGAVTVQSFTAAGAASDPVTSFDVSCEGTQ